MLHLNQPVTALKLGDPDDGDYGRRQRGMAIAALVLVEKNRLGYKVPSQSGNGSYVVNLDDKPFCTCPDFEKHQQPCKHIYAVEFIIQREERPDGVTIETKTMLVTYRQDWPAYNAAQTTSRSSLVNCYGNCAMPFPSQSRRWAAPAAPIRYGLRG